MTSPDPASDFARLASFADLVGDSRTAADARELGQQQLRRDLNVLVIGQYKRGKSTLINALLGEDLMPTGALPVTGVLTVLRHGLRAAIRVRFRNERVAIIGPDELVRFVSERGNPNNILGVDHVEVSWAASILEGLALYDTPGIGSIWEHNSATARDALERADAVILVVGPDPPIGAMELDFVRSVLRSSERLFVVMNKSDTSPALDDVVAFTEETLATVVGRPLDLAVISATEVRDAQRHGQTNVAFEVFRERLRVFVREHGDATRLRSLRRRAIGLADRLAVIVDMQRQARSLTSGQRRDARAAVVAAMQVLDDRVRILELLVDDDVKRLRLGLDEELARMKTRDQNAFRAHAPQLAEIGDAHRRTEVFQALLGERADVWRAELIAVIRGVLGNAEGKYRRALCEIETAALAAGCLALDLRDSHVLPERDVTIPRPRIDHTPSLSPQTGLELVRDIATDALPKAIRRRVRAHRLDRSLAQELDALDGKMRYGISRDLETWRQATRGHITSSLAATRDMIVGLFDDAPVIESDAFDDLNRRTFELESIRTEFGHWPEDGTRPTSMNR